MKRLGKVASVVLIVLNVFLALTAFAGGIGLEPMGGDKIGKN